MSELLEFAAQLIELEGGAVDAHAEGLAALLPPSLSAAWRAPEDLVLSERGEGPERLAYGTELLERMIESATGSLPAAHARLDVSTLRASQVQSAAQHWHLRNGVTEVGEVRSAPQLRVWVDALATLHGDEKRELMVSAAASLGSATEVEGFGTDAYPLLSASDPGSPTLSAAAIQAALRGCVRGAEEAASGFRAACEGCSAGAPRPAACDDAVHLLCDTCAPRAEGRIACPACARSARSKQLPPAAVSQSAQP